MRSETEAGWAEVFEALHLDRALDAAGVAYVTADEIKMITGREPRLMTKFDTREYRPNRIKQAECTILPVQNGRYALVRGDGYHDVAEAGPPRSFFSPNRRQLETFPRVCGNESEAIDAAFYYGILQDFLGDDDITLTMRGRRRSPRFDFSFCGADSPRLLQVDGVQVEIDSGYEGDRVYVLEAKMGARDNFIIRQLFYPTRMCSARGVRKRVVPLFMTYSNQIFTLSEYRFEVADDYGSILHVRSAAYLLETSSPRISSLREIMETTELRPEELATPFPQANDMRKVIDVIDAVVIGSNTRSQIACRYEFADRQAKYYGDAARYLGFLAPKRSGYVLTTEGARLAEMPARRKIETVTRAMARSPVFRDGLRYLLQSGTVPEWSFFAKLIGESPRSFSESTVERRAKAAVRWIEWVKRNLQPAI